MLVLYNIIFKRAITQEESPYINTASRLNCTNMWVNTFSVIIIHQSMSLIQSFLQVHSKVVAKMEDPDSVCYLMISLL